MESDGLQQHAQHSKAGAGDDRVAGHRPCCPSPTDCNPLTTLQMRVGMALPFPVHPSMSACLMPACLMLALGHWYPPLGVFVYTVAPKCKLHASFAIPVQPNAPFSILAKRNAGSWHPLKGVMQVSSVVPFDRIFKNKIYITDVAGGFHGKQTLKWKLAGNEISSWERKGKGAD